MIYFILAGTAVKIGRTANVPARVAGMQTGCPHDLRILAILEGEKKEERELHRRFASKRLRGEWFKYDRDIAVYLNDRKSFYIWLLSQDFPDGPEGDFREDAREDKSFPVLYRSHDEIDCYLMATKHACREAHETFGILWLMYIDYLKSIDGLGSIYCDSDIRIWAGDTTWGGRDLDLHFETPIESISIDVAARWQDANQK